MFKFLNKKLLINTKSQPSEIVISTYESVYSLSITDDTIASIRQRIATIAFVSKKKRGATLQDVSIIYATIARIV